LVTRLAPRRGARFPRQFVIPGLWRNEAVAVGSHQPQEHFGGHIHVFLSNASGLSMANLRRALVFASGGRYVITGINLVSTIILARLLTPAEFGISVLGTAVVGIAEAIRELGSISYLVQEKELTLRKTRTVFTISLVVTSVITILLVVLSGPLADFYRVPMLAHYIRAIALSYAIAPFAHPLYALLTRDMAFGVIAALDITTALLNAGLAICLVLLGFSLMGLAWAAVISNAAWTIMGFCVKRDLSIYVPSLGEWRSVLAFSAYGSARALLYRASESLFYLILGKILDASAVGLCQRALLLAKFPENVILAGIGAVALPAFSAHARHGRDLKTAYLGAIEHVTAVLWPAQIVLCMLAEPIVTLLLGSQWREAIPLMQIFAIAFLFNFSTSLNYPLQVAAGGISHTVSVALCQMAVSLTIMSFAAGYGLKAVALSTILTIPFNVCLSVWLVRSLVPFGLLEFAGALKKSAICTLFSAAGPVVVLFTRTEGTDMTIEMLSAVVMSCCAGWAVGLWLSHHPMFRELSRACALAAGLAGTKFSGARVWIIGRR
jgi:O-antigen/teichoic acid export membrane protein